MDKEAGKCSPRGKPASGSQPQPRWRKEEDYQPSDFGVSKNPVEESEVRPPSCNGKGKKKLFSAESMVDVATRLPQPTMIAAAKEIAQARAHPRSVPVITKKPTKVFRVRRTVYREDPIEDCFGIRHEEVGRSACEEAGRSPFEEEERPRFEEERPEGPPPDEEPFVFEESECPWLEKMFKDALKLNHERKLARNSSGRVVADCSALHRSDSVCQFCDVREQSTDRATMPSESFRKYQESLLRPPGQETSAEAATVTDIAETDPEGYSADLWRGGRGNGKSSLGKE